jgi:hypothetical protein
MRFVVVAVVLALLSVQAHAQMGNQQGGGAAADPKDVDRQKRISEDRKLSAGPGDRRSLDGRQ